MSFKILLPIPACEKQYILLSLSSLFCLHSKNFTLSFFNNFTNEYLFINLILISLLLDGADGFLSRYLIQDTTFGSLFDQEVDNFLILILTISLVYNYDFIFLILIIPIYRYIFILSIRLKIISNQSLPPSFFRKLICVMTILSLALSNIYSTVDSIRILLYVVFILISYSFVKDAFYLYRRKYD